MGRSQPASLSSFEQRVLVFLCNRLKSINEPCVFYSIVHQNRIGRTVIGEMIVWVVVASLPQER